MIVYSHSIKRTWTVILMAVVIGALVVGSVQGAPKKKKKRTSRSKLSLISVQSGTTTWKNLRGSTMVLIADGKGNLTGEYVTAVGCPEVVGKPQRLFGTINGSAISFTVNWGEQCASLTSWVGQIDDPTKITTLWLLAVRSKGPTDFKATYAGSDTFTRTSQ